MAYTTINKSSDHFDTRTYSASGAGSVSDVAFQPDFLWFKNRTGVGDHGLMDAIRGVNKILHSNDAVTERTSGASNDFTAFTSNGFTYGASSQLDTSTGTPCTWLWKANGTGSANTAGSINSTVSANTTSGFSIVKYTGTGANATVGHGLGSVPKMIIVKDLTNAENWEVYNAALGATKSFYLNATTVPFISSERWNDTSPTNSVFSLGTAKTNNNNANIIAYCFADVQGFSKFGSYIGNDNGDGPFIYTGFKPAFVMIKRKDGTGNWSMIDNKRSSFNECNNTLRADLTSVQYTATDQSNDMLSNGFKIRNNDNNFNVNNSTYIYMAFAEAPLVGTNGVTAKAR